MSGVAVYMEGGGDSTDTKALLRQGMSEFLRSLREAARQKGLHWRVVPCGGRNDAHDAFLNEAITSPDNFNVLLVDSEGPVPNSVSLRSHLNRRDGWDLRAIGERPIHLMIQTMEAWIVADAEAVARYCGQRFLKKALPAAQNLGGIEKSRIENALERATANTQKKEYRKIRDAAALLRAIDPEIVRLRCPSCERLFAIVSEAIDVI